MTAIAKTSFVPLAGAQPRQISTRLGVVEVAETGRPDGPLHVALHGAMGGWDQSLLLARSLLDDDARVLSVSRPGYLGTPLASGASPEAQSDLVAALLDELGEDAAAVIAISGGGPCALAFALRHPERCRRLVLVSTCAGVNEARIPLRFAFMKLFARLPGVPSYFRRKALSDPGRLLRKSVLNEEHRLSMLGDERTMALYTALVGSMFENMVGRLAGTDNDIRITRSVELPLDRIAVQTLVVHGTADEQAPFEPHARRLSREIPGARLLAVEGGEHMTLFTHRQLVGEAVRGFLAEA